MNVRGTAMCKAGMAAALMSSDVCGRIYTNTGNEPLIELLDHGSGSVLDVGCGAGDNAVLVKARFPDCQIIGVTRSEPEAELARRYMQECWVFDIEGDVPTNLHGRQFDTIIFSHVLEHLRDPAAVLAKFVSRLRPRGVVLIAVPNVLNWRYRLQFICGRFEYEAAGILDDTHLRFFTYFTADRYLLARSPNLRIMHKSVTGGVPLWVLRRYLLSKSWSESIDAWGCHRWPNLFGNQILIKAVLS